MIRYEKETEDFLVSITKNCEALFDETHTKPQETLHCKLTKPKEPSHLNHNLLGVLFLNG